MFCWFVKEKGLIPDTLFDERKLPQILAGFAPDKAGAKDSVFYKAILQNLFFATLNTEMDKRGWARDEQNFMAHSLYRHQDLFQNPGEALALFKNIPFLNGGLFECLDKDLGQTARPRYLRIDGFSRRPDCQPVVPDFLFFGPEREVDLSDAYGDKKYKRARVRGLIHIFNHYKFTITENTPIEEEIALDPELSGKVFENLLAAYNPETGATARKQTGSFYTPREIVNYMVDEALIACLKTKLESTFNPEGVKDKSPGLRGAAGRHPGNPDGKNTTNPEGVAPPSSALCLLPSSLEPHLRHLFAYNDEPHQFNPREVDSLIAAVDHLKALDPACGSGAFPMGLLHKLVFILGKLDPRNERWQQQQIAKANEIPDATIREKTLADIEQAFAAGELDYGRKLYLIENCIYGVDIQPIAVQIAKMRFFISLVVDQKIDDAEPNRGVRPLPNLETKFVAANTLIGIEKPAQQMLRNPRIDAKEAELRKVRERHFTARTPATKARCREQDAKLRAEISELLRADGFARETTEKLARWDPYDQNASADFFDAEWMFGLREGFDIVIGNPPYVRQEEIKDLKPVLQAQGYTCYTGTADLYVYFYERALQILRDGGVLSFISSNKFFRSAYGEKLRALLAKQTIHRIIDFGDAPVFTAIAYPAILILSKAPVDGHNVRALSWELGPPIEQFPDIVGEQSFPIAQTELKPDGWRLESPAVLRLVEKLRAAGKPLGEYVKGRFYYGIKTGLNEAFVVDRATRDRLIAEHKSSAELLKPFLRGRDVKRWRIEPQDLWLIFTRRGINIKKYPAIYEHLLPFKKRLMPGTPGGRKPGSYEWYEIQDNIAYWQEFEQPKVLYPDIYEHQSFTWDERGFLAANTCYFIPTREKWMTALLNSQTVEWFYASSGMFWEFFIGPDRGPSPRNGRRCRF
jgi:hypothetical protein